MPCHSYQPNLTTVESGLTMIFNVYDDLKGTFKHLKYPHPKIYELECSKERLDRETNNLCEILQHKSSIELGQYGYITQRWWLNHQIMDFKRLIDESKKVDFQKSNLSNYEMRLLHDNTFLNCLVEDAFKKVEERFNNFNKEQGIEWQKNITRNSFVQVMSSFELFSELMYLKTYKNEVEDSFIFKDYKKSSDFWKDTFQETFEDWISFNENFELKRYFEKYFLIILPVNKARTYFNALSTQNEKNENLIFTINDSMNAIKVLRKVKDEILGKKIKIKYPSSHQPKF